MLDTSVLGQRGHPTVRERLIELADDSWVCDMVVAESLTRSRSEHDLRARRAFFHSVGVLPVNGEVWETVNEWADHIAASRLTVATGDVVIAACASLAGLTVLHYDADYQALAACCDVDHEWVVPAGSL